MQKNRKHKTYIVYAAMGTGGIGGIFTGILLISARIIRIIWNIFRFQGKEKAETSLGKNGYSGFRVKILQSQQAGLEIYSIVWYKSGFFC